MKWFIAACLLGFGVAAGLFIAQRSSSETSIRDLVPPMARAFAIPPEYLAARDIAASFLEHPETVIWSEYDGNATTSRRVAGDYYEAMGTIQFVAPEGKSASSPWSVVLHWPSGKNPGYLYVQIADRTTGSYEWALDVAVKSRR